MTETKRMHRGEILALAGEIACAYLAKNTTAAAEVPGLIQAIFDKLHGLAADEPPAPAALTPSVPIKRSVQDDHIVCLEDGKKLKTLKRHLATAFGMTPEQYRAKWGLPGDYPMVAPAYARTRKELALKIGLGRKKSVEPPKKVRRTRKVA